MKKKIIAIVAIVLVLAISVGAIFLATAKESKQITSENLNTFYDVAVEITDYKEGEKSAEFLGLVSTYEASTAKIHIIATPKDKIVCDGAKLEYEFKDDFWNVVDGSDTITVNLNAEGVTEVYIDIESDLKISVVNAPELDTVKLTNALGTVTYKKFFNKLG
ncbi:MAG: hypothetical protein J6Q87_01395 [Clostridia bacterium]|jgi:hypothetical protein|nr:hypothetical protein [Clostridia bacterium]